MINNKEWSCKKCGSSSWVKNGIYKKCQPCNQRNNKKRTKEYTSESYAKNRPYLRGDAFETNAIKRAKTIDTLGDESQYYQLQSYKNTIKNMNGYGSEYELRFSIDHHVPVNTGIKKDGKVLVGLTTIENLVIVDTKTNQSKKNTMPDDYTNEQAVWVDESELESFRYVADIRTTVKENKGYQMNVTIRQDKADKDESEFEVVPYSLPPQNLYGVHRALCTDWGWSGHINQRVWDKERRLALELMDFDPCNVYGDMVHSTDDYKEPRFDEWVKDFKLIQQNRMNEWKASYKQRLINAGQFTPDWLS